MSIMHWIDGGLVIGAGERAEVTNPATGKVTNHLTLADEHTVDTAVAAATAALANWAATPLVRRQQVLFRYRDLVDRHIDDLARCVTAEHGKTIDDARGEVQRGLEVVEFMCALPHLTKGAYSAEVSTGVDTYNLRQPVGVCVGITPFNFPVMVPMWMFPVAIGCGNTFVLKPSEKDPSASVMLAELFSEAGLPPGVFNVVHGDKLAVDRLLQHRDVAAVSFVGSTPIAQYVYERAAATGKRVQALGGAKNHMVVLPDADIDQAADAAVSAGFGSAGERCMAISVIVAVGSVADRLVEAIRQRTEQLVVGPGDHAAAQMGPLVTAAHHDRVASYLESGKQDGARLVVDGRHHAAVKEYDGYFLGPSLFDHVSPDMSIYRDEIFGPVLSIVRVDSYDAAVELINANAYGNGTAIFTNDGGAARRFQQDILVGMVGINVPIPVPLSFYSFGGWKSSLFGDHAIYGPDGVHFYTRQKVVISRWPDPGERGVDLGFPKHR